MSDRQPPDDEHPACTSGVPERVYDVRDVDIIPPGPMPQPLATWRRRPNTQRARAECENQIVLNGVHERLWGSYKKLEKAKQEYFAERAGRQHLPAHIEHERQKLNAQVEDWKEERNEKARKQRRQAELDDLDHEIALKQKRKQLADINRQEAAAADPNDPAHIVQKYKDQKAEFDAKAECDRAKAQALEAERTVKETEHSLRAADTPPPARPATPAPELREELQKRDRKRGNQRFIQQQIDALLATVGGDQSKLSDEGIEELEDLQLALEAANRKIDREMPHPTYKNGGGAP